MTFLLEAGAAMVSPPHDVDPALGFDGRSCLCTAVERGFNEMIGILIEAGADVHERTIHGWSVMCLAARAGNAFAVHDLSDAGAPVIESDGDAPLFYAIRNWRKESVKALREGRKSASGRAATAAGHHCTSRRNPAALA